MGQGKCVAFWGKNKQKAGNENRTSHSEKGGVIAKEIILTKERKF
jgi:hypothetical protein